MIDSLGSGGAQRQMVGLALGLKGKGFDVSFLTYHKLNFFLDILTSNSIPVNTIVEPSYFKRTLKVRRFIRNGKYDSVIAFLSGSCFMSEVAKLPTSKWKLIVGERSANPAMMHSLKWKVFRSMHGIADYVVANSSANIEMIKATTSIIPEKKLKVIYNLVDLEKWYPSHSYIYLENEFRLIVVSSHQYLKNLVGLVKGVSKLTQNEISKLKIDWYGDVQDKSFDEGSDLIKKFSLEKVFTFHKAVSNIVEKIQSSDALGLFSIYEGLPNAVCEAMACGKPVIASNISDLGFIVNNSELLFDPKSEDSIALALRKLLSYNSSELIAIGDKNRKRAIELFNKERILQQYIELLK